MITTFSTSSCVKIAASLPLACRDGKEKRLGVCCPCCCCGRWKEKEVEEAEEAEAASAAAAGDDEEEWRVLREDCTNGTRKPTERRSRGCCRNGLELARASVAKGRRRRVRRARRRVKETTGRGGMLLLLRLLVG